ncbi:MAG: hypothetical protein QOF55_220 [Thermoleophilaceae bacterium]|nr:hypothetical protein [Thermoleophilaceae bacterium]
MGEGEERTAKAVEELVHSDSFGELLARVTQNVMGVTKIGFDVLDLTVRNLRLAGRPDLIRLGRQLARNEDKLERVLQEVESLRDQVAASEKPPSARNGGDNGGGSRRQRSSTNGGTRAKSKPS